MISIFFPPGSFGDQIQKDWKQTQIAGDADGWVLWADHRPEPDVPVEVKRDDVDGVDVITPRAQTLEWNIAGVWWRLPK